MAREESGVSFLLGMQFQNVCQNIIPQVYAYSNENIWRATCSGIWSHIHI